MNKITIRADLLKGMAILASKDQTRYAINVVCLSIRDKIPRLIATDGRIMGMLLCEDSDLTYAVEQTGDFQLSIPIPDFRRLGCGSSKIAIDQDEKNTRISYGDFTQTLPTPLGKFPDVEPVIPPENTPVSTGIDLDLSLLHRFTEALKTMGYKNYGYLHLRGGGTDKNGNQNPLHVFNQNDRFYGVISGLRRDRDYTVPTWAKPARPPEPEAEINTPTATTEPTQPANPPQETIPA